MNDLINWNAYVYKGSSVPLIEQLRKLSTMYKKNTIEGFSSRQKALPRNKYGIPRITYYAGFTPWTNTPVANRNGGNIANRI